MKIPTSPLMKLAPVCAVAEPILAEFGLNRVEPLRRESLALRFLRGFTHFFARGNCWDNAVMERFFRSLKVESISRYRHQSQEELVWAVKKYIHFYNTQRIHSAIGSMSPSQYEQHFLKAA